MNKINNFAVFNDKEELCMVAENFRTEKEAAEYIVRNELKGTDYFIGKCDDIEITIEELLNQYGEYGVPFEVAKQLDCYKYTVKEEGMDKIRKLFKEYGKYDNYDVIDVLEFGNIDIELGITKSNGDINILDFFVCCNFETGWSSYDFSDYEIKEEDLKDVLALEKVMYRELMEYARINNLYWSRKN